MYKNVFKELIFTLGCIIAVAIILLLSVFPIILLIKLISMFADFMFK